MNNTIVRTDYDLQYGERYRQMPKGDSSPLMQKWIDFEAKRKEQRRKVKAPAKTKDETVTPVVPNQSVEFTQREQAIIKALNEYYGPALGEGRRHPTFTEQTSHWLCWVCENNPEKAIAIAYELDFVKDWQPMPNEVEDLVRSAASKKVLTHTPKALKELLQKAGIESGAVSNTAGKTDDDLSFGEWNAQLRSLFGIFPCLQEVCEPHPERLWPFLFLASGALEGTLMTRCRWRHYQQPEKLRALNYNILGIGDPAVGKGALERIAGLWCEPIEQADQLVNDMTNDWKDTMRSQGSNKDKAIKPKGIVRLHGARCSNGVFIGDMMNAFDEVDGERLQLHMLTVDTEALNSIKMQKGGSWIDRSVMEIKAWSNEKDSQQYANLDSVTGFFDVYWNLVRTCTPPALRVLANERNFGSGWPLRVSAIPIPDNDFDMIPLQTQSEKHIEANEIIRQWAYKLDKRHGELPLWPLVEYAWHWTDEHMEIARFNQDKADRMLLKRIAVNALCLAAPWVDMRHWNEREKSGTYEIDDLDKSLLELVLDIQYKTQRHYFYELARNYFDEQMKDATQFRRRTTRFEQCFQQLPDEFTTEQFAQTFGYANPRSAAKTIDRFLKDKTIERTKRGEYRKRVNNIG